MTRERGPYLAREPKAHEARERDREYATVSKALRRRVTPGLEPVRVVAEVLAFPLAHLLDARAVALTLEPSFALAEILIADVELATPTARLVVLAGNEWTSRLLSAAGARAWPRVFEPFRGLNAAERPAFVRRACNAARDGKSVCGIKPWRIR